MRAALLAATFAVGACQQAAEQNATAEADGKIDCRIGADQQFARFCSLERTKTEQGTLITVRKPDGGFRRLVTKQDGTGVAAADGAEQAEVAISGENQIDVTIAGDTFRLPARIGPVSQPGT